MISLIDANAHEATANIYPMLRKWAVQELGGAVMHPAVAAYYQINSPVCQYCSMVVREVIGRKHLPVLSETLVYAGGHCIPEHTDRRGLDRAAIWPVFAAGSPPSDFMILGKAWPQKENEILFFNGSRYSHYRKSHEGGMIVMVMFYSLTCGVFPLQAETGKRILEEYR